MAPAACPSLHELEGHCEYCGEACDSTQDELNAIACTFEGCPSPTIYHQHCIETYLKTIRLDKQRKTGFQCPRGCGKGSRSDKPCPGRVTKSHPIHARNDCSKKRRKSKMPEAAPPVLAAPAAPAKEEEERAQQLNKTKSVKIEKDKDKMDGVESKSVPKPLVLNRASTFPSLVGSKGTPNETVSVNCSPSHTSSGVPKLLSRESTVAAIAAARSEIAASKRGGSLKNHSESYVGGRSDQSIASYDSRSTQNSDSDDESTKPQLISSKDFRKVLSAGRGGVDPAPVVNAWALGRSCNELLNGSKQKDVRPPAPHIAPSNPAQDIRASTNSTSSAQPLTTGQPSAERVGLPIGEEDDLEARRLKARTKNEKKHLQRAARAREKREAEEAAAALAATSTAATVLQKESQPKQPESGPMLRPWSEMFTNALCQQKFSSLAKLLQEYGFADWQSNLALRICGSDLEQCLDWLLRNAPSLRMDMPVQHEKRMDITMESNRLKEVILTEGFTQEQVEVAVISTSGDVDAALKHLRSLSLYCDSPLMEAKESSQNTYNTMASPYHSFGQPSSQSSSDLATGVWDSMLNGTADGQDFSPLGGSANGSDSYRSFGPFAGGFISDLSRYNSLLTVDDSQLASGKVRPVTGPYFIGDQGQSKSLWTTPASQGSNVDYYDAFSGGLQSHLQNSCELTSSTVTSVAAAVLNDTFGFDEQMISRLTEVIAANEAPFNSSLNAIASLNGIWSYQPTSTFSNFAPSKGLLQSHSVDSFPYMSSHKSLDGQSYFHAGLGVFGERPTAAAAAAASPEPVFKHGYGHSGALGTSRWEDHAVKLVDDAEEQELLMSELLSQLLV